MLIYLTYHVYALSDIISSLEPKVYLDLLFGKVKFGNLGFLYGKNTNSGFLRNSCSM